MHNIYYVGRIFRMEYLLWDEKSKTLSVGNKFSAKFCVAFHIFIGKSRKKLFKCTPAST